MKKAILCYGDSNTYGYNPMGGRYDRDSRWPTVMAKALGENYHIVEEGLGGRTFCLDDPNEGGFKSGVAYLPPCLMSHSPLELVIVMLGTNDLKHRFCLSPQVIAHSLKEFVRLTRAYGVNQAGECPKILIVAPPPIGDWLDKSILYGHFGPEAVEKSRQLAPNMRRYAKLLGCAFFDAGQVAAPSRIDAVHLPAGQHQALGLALAEEAKKLLAP